MKVFYDEDRIISIKLRDDLVVSFDNIPHDLSQREADRLCRLIQALAVSDEAGRSVLAEEGET